MSHIFTQRAGRAAQDQARKKTRCFPPGSLYTPLYLPRRRRRRRRRAARPAARAQAVPYSDRIYQPSLIGFLAGRPRHAAHARRPPVRGGCPARAQNTLTPNSHKPTGPWTDHASPIAKTHYKISGRISLSIDTAIHTEEDSSEKRDTDAGMLLEEEEPICPG